MALHTFSEIEGGAIKGLIEYNASNRNIQNVIVERASTVYRPTFIVRDRTTNAEVYRETVSATETSLRLVRPVPGGYKMVADVDTDTGQATGQFVPPFNLELVA
jgi:hypothetical protein